MKEIYIPPGYRFSPTEVVLVLFYLKRKIEGRPFHYEAISEVDLYKFEPWDLRELFCLNNQDRIWYFFCSLGSKYLKGKKVNRTTKLGYWKATGKRKKIHHANQLVGMRQTFIFYAGKPKESKRTNWVMHEYKLEGMEQGRSNYQNEIVLCKIYEKSEPGPKSGEEYGVLFEDETDNEIDKVKHVSDDENGNGSSDMCAPFASLPNPAPISSSFKTTNACNLVTLPKSQTTGASDCHPFIEDDDISWLVGLIDNADKNGYLYSQTDSPLVPVPAPVISYSAAFASTGNASAHLPQSKTTGVSNCHNFSNEVDSSLQLNSMDSCYNAVTFSASVPTYSQYPDTPIVSLPLLFSTSHHTEQIFTGDSNFTCSGSETYQMLDSIVPKESSYLDFTWYQLLWDLDFLNDGLCMGDLCDQKVAVEDDDYIEWDAILTGPAPRSESECRELGGLDGPPPVMEASNEDRANTSCPTSSIICRGQR